MVRAVATVRVLGGLARSVEILSQCAYGARIAPPSCKVIVVLADVVTADREFSVRWQNCGASFTGNGTVVIWPDSTRQTIQTLGLFTSDVADSGRGIECPVIGT